MQEKYRILLVGYNALSKESANGRTLESLLRAFKKDETAQLFFSAEQPDFQVASQYYRVDEKNLLKSLFTGGLTGTPVIETPKKEDAPKQGRLNGFIHYLSGFAKKYKRFTLVKYLRGLLWTKGKKKWKTEVFDEWVRSFSPDVVLTISGKNSCFHQIAMDIADDYRLPLVVYHCEDYCFKQTKGKTLIYKAYIRKLKQSVDGLMCRASLAIFNSDALRELYSSHYSTPSIVTYMSTDMTPRKKRLAHDSLTISYMGNLGLGRFTSLCEIGEQLKNIAPTAQLNLYAPSMPKKFSRAIKNMPNIHYRGFVDYEQCKTIMYESDLLVHAEGFDEKTVKELKIAFSTKIADSLASGVPFFVYAPRGIASTEYLLRTKSACVATDRDELRSQLNFAISHLDRQSEYVENALKIVSLNHILSKTASMVKTEIKSAITAYRSLNAKE